MFRTKGYQSFVIFVTALALVSLSCGISNIPFLATETPTPTITFTPTPTFTPSPTPTQTQTPSPTPLPTGIVTEEQADGSTLFTDYDNQYQLTLPKDWKAIPFDKDNLGAMLDELAKEDPKLADAASAFKDLDPKVFRLVALNTNSKYIAGGSVSNLNITAIENELLSTMPLSFVSGALEESLKQQGATVLTDGVNIVENAQGVEVEFIDIEQTITGIKIVQRLILFQSNDKLIAITVSAAKQFSEEVLPEGNLIGGSIKFLE